MITKKNNGGNMENNPYKNIDTTEVRLKYNELKKTNLPKWQIIVRIQKEFGMEKANAFILANYDEVF